MDKLARHIPLQATLPSIEGVTNSSGADCFVFNDRARENNIYGLVPVSSDTADEAINALIASTLICREFTARQIKDSQYAQAVVTSVQSEPQPTPSQKPATSGIDHTGMPINVLNRIKAKAQKDWSDDYSMQKYQIEEESEAYLDLHPEIE